MKAWKRVSPSWWACSVAVGWMQTLFVFGGGLISCLNVTLAEDGSPTVSADPTSADARVPIGDHDLRFWLENMAEHQFADAEIAAAIGLQEHEIAATRSRLGVSAAAGGSLKPGLRVLPYPGGRHPRIGFLDGAVRPQRETKLSVFTPWDRHSYVVLDVPEAIWSNLGLTYLAHTHIPTVFDEQGISLAKLEWKRDRAGVFRSERRLPNGIEFGTAVRPAGEHLQLEMWLHNGTDTTLTDLRVQNCVMLARAPGFAAQTNDNKTFRDCYAACRSTEGQRWIISAWSPIHRPWGNPPCPCLHADPKFPDCEPGQTVRVRGWFSFYEGASLERELNRIESTGWKQAEPLVTNPRAYPLRMPVYPELPEPPARTRAEVAELLAGAETIAENAEPVRLVLVAGPKDHGPGEHDYPAWQRVWAEWLAYHRLVNVETAWEFPTADQLAAADVLVFYQRGRWDEERQAAIDTFLKRGGGLVYIHWAVDGRGGQDEMAKRIGLAALGGQIKYRHGPLEIDFSPGREHSIARNLTRVRWFDESYWDLVGDRSQLGLLGTSLEDNAPRPQFWVMDAAAGRVFVSIPGHYMWTFDDPVYRTVLLRGIAWAARRPVDLFNELVTLDARLD